MSSIIGGRSEASSNTLSLDRCPCRIRYPAVTAFILLSLLPIFFGYLNRMKIDRSDQEKAEIFRKRWSSNYPRTSCCGWSRSRRKAAFLVLSDRVQGALTRVANGSAKEQSEARRDMTRLLLEHYGSIDFINQKYLLDKNNRIMDTRRSRN